MTPKQILTSLCINRNAADRRRSPQNTSNRCISPPMASDHLRSLQIASHRFRSPQTVSDRLRSPQIASDHLSCKRSCRRSPSPPTPNFKVGLDNGASKLFFVVMKCSSIGSTLKFGVGAKAHLKLSISLGWQKPQQATTEASSMSVTLFCKTCSVFTSARPGDHTDFSPPSCFADYLF